MATEYFMSSSGAVVRLKSDMHSWTENVVYLNICYKCQKQFVGETECPMNLRMNGHHDDWRHCRFERSRVAERFCSSEHNFLSHGSVCCIDHNGLVQEILQELLDPSPEHWGLMVSTKETNQYTVKKSYSVLNECYVSVLYSRNNLTGWLYILLRSRLCTDTQGTFPWTRWCIWNRLGLRPTSFYNTFIPDMSLLLLLRCSTHPVYSTSLNCTQSMCSRRTLSNIFT